MRLAVTIISVGAFLAGCQTAAPPQPMASRFDNQQAEFAQRTGSGAITGQAFARQLGGGIVTAGGNSVFLFPDQQYTRELSERMGNGLYKAGDEKPVHRYTRIVTADASGNFRFDDLAPGRYLVNTKVEWGVPVQHGIIMQGAVMAEPVVVTAGSVTQVILSR